MFFIQICGLKLRIRMRHVSNILRVHCVFPCCFELLNKPILPPHPPLPPPHPTHHPHFLHRFHAIEGYSLIPSLPVEANLCLQKRDRFTLNNLINPREMDRGECQQEATNLLQLGSVHIFLAGTGLIDSRPDTYEYVVK